MQVLRYTRVAMVLHWTVAALMILAVGLALSAEAFGDDWVRPIVDTHKSVGLTVLGLVILRLLWRAAHPAPPLPVDYGRWERTAAFAAHMGLYGLMLALPISGWLHDSAWNGAAAHPLTLYGVIPWFRIGWLADLDPATKDVVHAQLFAVHQALGYALYALVALHVAGALKHQFLDRQPELQRMTPGR
jgi:cytochrome b561